MNLNKATIIGRITNTPELKTLPTGVKVCSFSVATNEFYKNSAGQNQEKTEFHNIVCFAKTAENVAQYMTKGSEILIEGKIQTRSWESDGMKKYRTEIIAHQVQFGAKPKVANGDQGYASAVDTSKDESGIEFPDDDINPEDIPF